MFYVNILKPIFDFLIAALGFVLMLPFFILIVVLLSIANKGNPFFFQCRPGKRGKVFKIIKFKTMNDMRDSKGVLLPDAKRLTFIGSLIRKISLDEIPQLINVIKFDMSLIGPRPLLVEYLPLYNVVQFKRHEVKPGITGWAQVNGRNAITWEQKFEYDIWYVKNISLVLDMKILFLTLKKVFFASDINQLGHATTEKFIGSKQ
jgi:undecaprenyl phosphate N,N'-diacetylbacillosamine 1-phosphate transferase